jgi:hypothetical protein
MDLEGMIQRIPETEKILGIVWIVSWFLAIWMYHVQFFITGLFCLFLILILVGRFDEKKAPKKPGIPAVFSMNKSTNTLKVQKIYEENLKWDDHEICSGSASLPSGSITEGDVIKDCKGNVAIRHIPSNTLFGAFNFEE